MIVFPKELCIEANFTSLIQHKELTGGYWLIYGNTITIKIIDIDSKGKNLRRFEKEALKKNFVLNIKMHGEEQSYVCKILSPFKYEHKRTHEKATAEIQVIGDAFSPLAVKCGGKTLKCGGKDVVCTPKELKTTYPRREK